jgi:hypothetical protein
VRWFKNRKTPWTTGATLFEIREQLRDWRNFGSGEERQRKTLSDWGRACEKSLAVLESYRLVWEITLKAVRTLPQFTSMVAPVRSSLTEISIGESGGGSPLKNGARLTSAIVEARPAGGRGR